MKLLIVEDEIQLSKSMATYLQRQGYTCDAAYDYKEGIYKIDSYEYDCILLDITLPGGSGLQLLKNIKADNKPDGVIIISAKDAIDEKIEGLNLGADDYIPKPFHLSELNARVAAVIRRNKFQGSSLLVFNELTIDLQAKTVLVNNKPVDISKKEYDLLLYLVSSKNRVISKNAIAENISGDSVELYGNYDFIYAHIKNLKRKLAAAGCEDYIKSVYGMGYKFTI